MKTAFKVTGLGLKVDGVMIMPGSEVTLSAPAPSHWSRFGEPSSGEKEMIVATPCAITEGAVEVPILPKTFRQIARIAGVAQVMESLDPDKDFTKGGQPEVDAINALISEDVAPVSAKERDTIWNAMQAAKAEAETPE